MRYSWLLVILLAQLVATFQPLKTFNIHRRQDDPDGKDPFEMDSPTELLSTLNNNTKRLKLEMDTEKYIEKFGPQQLLDLVLRKVTDTQNTFKPDARVAFERFLDFVENIIYTSSARRIEKQLKLDYSKQLQKSTTPKPSNSKVNDNEVSSMQFRRDAPAVGDVRQNSVIIDVAADSPFNRQPVEPSRLAYFSNLNNDLIQVSKKKEIRRSPQKIRNRKVSLEVFEKAVRDAERREKEREKQKPKDQVKKRRKLTKRTRQTLVEKIRRARKLPISKLDDGQRRRSPVKQPKFTLNERLFQLFEEYAVDSFLVETSEYTVRAFVDPAKTRFSTLTKVAAEDTRPAFVYSRTVKNEKEGKAKTAFERLL